MGLATWGIVELVSPSDPSFACDAPPATTCNSTVVTTRCVVETSQEECSSPADNATSLAFVGDLYRDHSGTGRPAWDTVASAFWYLEDSSVGHNVAPAYGYDFVRQCNPIREHPNNLDPVCDNVFFEVGVRARGTNPSPYNVLVTDIINSRNTSLIDLIDNRIYYQDTNKLQEHVADARCPSVIKVPKSTLT